MFNTFCYHSNKRLDHFVVVNFIGPMDKEFGFTLMDYFLKDRFQNRIQEQQRFREFEESKLVERFRTHSVCLSSSG